MAIKHILTTTLLLITTALIAQDKMVNTYSIIARNPLTGKMGGAVQSHYFSVGSVVLRAEAGVGVVATQALVNPNFGPEGIRVLEDESLNATQTLKTLIDSDQGQFYRQVAILDNNGDLAQHTGSKNIPQACMIKGQNFAVQANMMLKKGVCEAMANAFEKAEAQKLSLQQCLMNALFAAQEAGGDVRGKQSAAMVIVNKESNPNPLLAKPLDLRVEDNKEPLKELQRLINIHNAYDFMNQGDVAMEKGDTEGAMELYGKAMKMFPENLEFIYWSADRKSVV